MRYQVMINLQREIIIDVRLQDALRGINEIYVFCSISLFVCK